MSDFDEEFEVNEPMTLRQDATPQLLIVSALI